MGIWVGDGLLFYLCGVLCVGLFVRFSFASVFVMYPAWFVLWFWEGCSHCSFFVSCRPGTVWGRCSTPQFRFRCLVVCSFCSLPRGFYWFYYEFFGWFLPNPFLSHNPLLLFCWHKMWCTLSRLTSVELCVGVQTSLLCLIFICVFSFFSFFNYFWYVIVYIFCFLFLFLFSVFILCWLIHIHSLKV